MNHEEVISAVRKSDQAWCEQVGNWESLGHGVAYCAKEFSSLPDVNQLRDVWLADTEPHAAYEQTEAHYQAHGATCHLWVPGSGQPIEPVESFLAGKGWHREELTALGLTAAEVSDSNEDESIRILPARAMQRAYRRSLSESSAGNEDYVNAGFERLDDANHDAFLALVDGDAAGRISYLEVGDVAAVMDFHVTPKHQERGVALALMAHVLRLARRLLPRVLATRMPAEDRTGQAFLKRCGFSEAGTLTQFRRSDG